MNLYGHLPLHLLTDLTDLSVPCTCSECRSRSERRRPQQKGGRGARLERRSGLAAGEQHPTTTRSPRAQRWYHPIRRTGPSHLSEDWEWELEWFSTGHPRCCQKETG